MITIRLAWIFPVLKVFKAKAQKISNWCNFCYPVFVDFWCGRWSHAEYFKLVTVDSKHVLFKQSLKHQSGFLNYHLSFNTPLILYPQDHWILKQHMRPYSLRIIYSCRLRTHNQYPIHLRWSITGTCLSATSSVHLDPFPQLWKK